MKEILKEVLKDIKPSLEEEKQISEKINRVIAKIQKALPETKVILGGSGEKGTWLREAHDADIFVKFPYTKYKEKSGELAEILEKKLRKIFRLSRLHGSRDYFQTMQEEFTFEIVPIIDIKKADDAVNITDVSPLHAEWVKKQKKYADEIRLTKQFFKAAKVYGAESYINGFSGYICEILTVYYKGFENLVKSIAKWSDKSVIDIERYYKNSKEALFSIDTAKTKGPLVIVDPVQKSRNAAAAVSKEKFDDLVKYCRDYIKKPSKQFFDIKRIDVQELRKKAKNDLLFIFEAEALGGKDDVIGCKLLKAFERINQEIQKNEFKIIYSQWEWEEKAYFYFVINKEELTDKKIIKGPPLRIKKAVEEFKKRHNETYDENGFVFAKEKRRYRTADVLMGKLLKDEYINERVKKIKLR